MSDKAKLFEKLVAVAAEIEKLPKLGRNDYFKYAFVRSEDVLDTVRAKLAEHGIAFFVSLDTHEREDFTDPDGKMSSKTTLVLDATFGCTETGESIVVRWPGEADDSQDKGTSKAMTMAVKYGLLKTFLISTGEETDPDGQAPVRQGAPASGDPGDAMITRGKHSGKSIRQVDSEDPSYLKWILDHPDFPNYTNVKKYMEGFPGQEELDSVKPIPFDLHWSAGREEELDGFLENVAGLSKEEAMAAIDDADAQVAVRDWGDTTFTEQMVIKTLQSYKESQRVEPF